MKSHFNSYERMSSKTRFEEEAKGNSEMAYSALDWPFRLFCMPFKKQKNI